MNIKNLVYFTLGVCTGGTIAYLITKEKYTDIMNEELDAMENHYEGRDQENVVHHYIVEGNDVKSIEPDKDPLSVEKNKYGKLARNYQNPSGDDIDEPYFHEQTDEKHLGGEVDYPAPYIISESEYSNGRREYDKCSIGYYSDDDTLVDEDDSIITKIDETVGGDNLLNFGTFSNDPDIVYVRNESLAIDYEIIRNYQSYQETVLGIYDEAEPHQRRERHEE